MLRNAWSDLWHQRLHTCNFTVRGLFLESGSSPCTCLALAPGNLYLAQQQWQRRQVLSSAQLSKAAAEASANEHRKPLKTFFAALQRLVFPSSTVCICVYFNLVGLPGRAETNQHSAGILEDERGTQSERIPPYCCRYSAQPCQLLPAAGLWQPPGALRASTRACPLRGRSFLPSAGRRRFVCETTKDRKKTSPCSLWSTMKY
ncbi:hypothetical protein GGI43DRAFT_282487 [Trichoderma evansii]